MWEDIKHFKPAEFDSPDSPGSGMNMDLAFVRKLDKLRDAIGRPLTITSGFRTEAHNATLTDSVDGSAHTTGHAADIHATTSRDRFELKQAAYTLGFRRIGTGKTFIHLDDDITKVQDVEWLYLTR